eukprot:6447906-Pyramimonas_sp.AAC.1
MHNPRRDTSGTPPGHRGPSFDGRIIISFGRGPATGGFRDTGGTPRANGRQRRIIWSGRGLATG